MDNTNTESYNLRHVNELQNTIYKIFAFKQASMALQNVRIQIVRTILLSVLREG